MIHFSELPKSHLRLGLALTSFYAFRFVLGLRPKPKMPPKKKQKPLCLSFRLGEQTEDKVDKSDPGPSTQTATESDRQKLSEKEGQKVKEKRPRVFQQNWKVLHPWLKGQHGQAMDADWAVPCRGLSQHGQAWSSGSLLSSPHCWL